MRRFRVAEDSMQPALGPGDEVVATDSRRAMIGDVVVLPHPDREGFWLVKRMAEPPHTIGEDLAWVVSDNAGVTKADSRTLGPVPSRSLLPVVQRLDPDTFVEACDLLAAEDEAIAHAVYRFGPPRFWQRKPGLSALVLLIAEQQVSLESGAAIYRRLEQHTGGVTAEGLARLGAEGMARIGLTRQKAGYMEGLARAVLDGSFDIDSLGRIPAPDARRRLMGVRGVGPWTADAYLLSALRLPDVLPVGDQALKVGIAEVLGLRRPPDEEALAQLVEPWRPVRAAAARIIWHAYLSKRGRVEPPDPTGAHETLPDA